MNGKRRSHTGKRLSLERLEDRILLGVVNPGEPAELKEGDVLYFVQGANSEEPDDLGGEPEVVVIASFFGPGYVRFQNAAGLPYSKGIANGDKIGDISFYDTTAGSSLYIQTGQFKEDFSISDIPAPLYDVPDTSDEALEIDVPEGDPENADDPYSTGRAVVAGLGTDADWFSFGAQEAEQFTISYIGADPEARIYVQYEDGPLVFKGINDYALYDDNGNGEQDDVTVYLYVPVPGGLPYSMVIDRKELEFDFDGDTVPDTATCAEDFPSTPDNAMDITGDAADGNVGFGPVTPHFTMTGEGAGHDYFMVTVPSGGSVLGSNFSGVNSVRVGGTNLVSGVYTNGSDEDAEVIIDVNSSGNWSFDLEMKPRPLSDMVELVTDPLTGEYIWWNADSTPWMNDYTPPGATEPIHVFAPAGSGGAVVTGNVSFNDDSTGFGIFAIDGSLKGSIGVPGATLDTNETINTILAGYINGEQTDFQGTTTGGTFIEGNVGSVLVQSTIAELAEANQVGDFDWFAPAEFYVGGYLMEMQTSGTVFANITVGGVGTFTNPVFNFDSADTEGFGGIYSDDASGAYVVGSPTGTFTVQGTTSESDDPEERPDPEDWYVFNAGLGQTITVQMNSLSDWPAWVFAPSGRLVAVVTNGEPASFVADEGGNYYLMAGAPVEDSLEEAQLVTLLPPWDDPYSITVSGARPVHLGGVVAGSNIFEMADTSEGLEFADDMTDTYIRVGYDWAGEPVATANLGFLEARGLGNYADANVATTGSAGYISGNVMATDDMDYPVFDIGGDLDRLESRAGDLQYNFIGVGGNLGELYCAATLGAEMQPPAGIIVQGHAGSVVVGEDLFAYLSVAQQGLDLFYVGGDFGSSLVHSALYTGFGTDVAFAYVGGDIYDLGDLVYPVSVTDETTDFVDDGGSHIHLTPVSTRTQTIIVDWNGYPVEREVPIPATLQYRYLPVGAVGGGPAGAVMTEIVANDAVEIVIDSGRADLPYLTFGEGEESYLTVSSLDPLAELDLYYVESVADSVLFIRNNTHQGDILNMNVGSVGRIVAGGHIGLTERFAPEGGRLPNPMLDAFMPPAVPYVSEQSAAYFNGVVATGDIGRIRAGGSIGDVYVAGDIGRVRADADRVANGTAFKFRGMERDARAWDGIAGVVYAGGDIGFINPGDGMYGGRGGVPIGGVFADGTIHTVSARDALIEGPIFSAEGIDEITGVRTMFHEATIGIAGDEGPPDYSDSALWDEIRETTAGARVEEITLTGVGSGFDSSIIEVGVLGDLYIGPGTLGMADCQVWALGDSITEEGINSITILGGGLDGTGAPPYGGFMGWNINSNQRIGAITLSGAGVDMTNMYMRSLKSIESISVDSNIVFNNVRLGYDSFISAPLNIGSISAANFEGTGTMYVGTGSLGELEANRHFAADVIVDGTIELVDVGRWFTGSLTTVGPQGSIEEAVIGRGFTGALESASYIGSIDVLSGPATGIIRAGGSDQNNLAIGSINVQNGDLGAVTTWVNFQALRPGGGIGSIVVNGSILDDITATSYYDPVRGDRITADVGPIRVSDGNIEGDVTIQRNNPADPRDTGGTLEGLIVVGGDLNGDVSVYGDIGRLIVRRGAINGTIEVLGSDVQRVVVRSTGGPAITDDISIEGDLGLLNVIGGDFVGDLSVGGTIGTLSLDFASQMLGQVSAGAIDQANFLSAGGLTQPVQVWGHVGELVVPYGTGPGAVITVGAGLDLLQSAADVQGDVTVTGDVGTVDIQDGNLGGVFAVIGDVQTLRILNGQLADNGLPDPGINIDGTVDSLQIYNPGGVATADDIAVGDYVGRAVLNGEVSRNITVGDNEMGDGINRFVLRGDLNGEFTVNGDVGRMSLIGGRVLSNGNPADERIEVSGNVDVMRVVGYTGGGAVIDDEVYVGDRLDYFLVNGGSFDGTLEAGTIGRLLYNTPNGITHDVISHTDLDYLEVLYGPISASVNVFHHAGTIVAEGGIQASGSLNIGSGLPGAGLDRLQVAGNFEGSVSVNGELSRVLVTGNAVGATVDVNGGGLGELNVGGDLLDTDVTVDESLLSVLVGGNYTDSDVNAHSLGTVRVNGTVSSLVPPDNEIHADVGSFDLFADGVYYPVNGGSYNINGVQVSVG